MARPFPDDGTARLFQIGTRPLDPENWLAPDENFLVQLAEKARLRIAHPAETFAELSGSRPAQAELLSLLADYLPRHFPDFWRREADGITILPNGETITLADPVAPLAIAAQLVQDDLLVLERGDEKTWKLTAASLSFPSSWSLLEKMGQGLDAIHGPVPGFGAGTRPAQIMARMFDAMRPENPMIRWNWSLYGDDRLFHPDVSSADQPRFGSGPRAEKVYLRVERQVLRKLPATGAIAFAIRISLQNLDDLATHPEASAIAAHLHTEVSALTPEQLDYKGLTLERARVLTRLDEMMS